MFHTEFLFLTSIMDYGANDLLATNVVNRHPELQNTGSP